MLCQNGGDDDGHEVDVHTHDNDVSHHSERKVFTKDFTTLTLRDILDLRTLDFDLDCDN